MSAKTILRVHNLDISFRTNAGTVHAIRGVKGLVAKFKAKKEEAEPEKAADQPDVEVVEVDNETMDEIQKAK